MRTLLSFSTFAVSALLVFSCGKEKQDEVVEGYKPIYATANDLENVDIRKSEVLENPGRIYLYENYLLVNDRAKGVHIYDNTNQNDPKEVSFIAIPGNLDFSVSNGMLYADNITDMLIIDISQPDNPVYKNRIQNVFPIQQFPDEFGAFECVDANLGTVIGWEKAQLTNPKCFK